MEGAFGASLVTILVATVAGWVFGALWYGALAKPWMRAAGLTETDIRGPSGKPSPAPYVLSIVAEFVMAYILAALLMHVSGGAFTLGNALAAAFLLWLGFVATSQMVNHRYSLKPWALTIIDTGHWLGVLLIQAAVMAMMGL